jgi:Ni/Co efflux regulator RcnB
MAFKVYHKSLVAAFMSAAMLLPNMAQATGEGDALLRAQEIQQGKRRIVKDAMPVAEKQVERDLGTEDDEYTISDAILSAATLSPSAAKAKEFQTFDNMANQDRQAFLDFLSNAAETVLEQEGRSADAQKVHQLFNEFPDGGNLPLGDAEHELNVDIARVADAKRAIQTPTLPRVQVEAALVVTLKKNGFVLSPAFVAGFAQMASTFPKFPPATAPSFAPTPLSLQPSSPSADDESAPFPDDPIGEGGFITPPDQSNGH